MQDATAAAVEAYGVGACGPRAFYGTIGVHLDLEAKLAQFMAAEEAIVYSFDVATMPSVLPAFASRKDVVVIDEAAAWPQRSGALLSRAQGVLVNVRHVRQSLCSCYGAWLFHVLLSIYWQQLV